MRKIIDGEHNKWKVVLVKTIENMEPMYYRIVNLYTYDIKVIPAYRIFDAVLNQGLNIINLKCENNKPILIDEDGYASTEGVIVIDLFDEEIPNIMDWCLQNNEMGNLIMSKYDSEKNTFSPSNYRIDSRDKIAWTCENKHTIRCGFPTFFSTKAKCPICELEANGETLSLAYWTNITGNRELLNMYDSSSENTDLSCKINYKAHKRVFFRDTETDEEIAESLYEITVEGKELPFKNKRVVNLKR